MSTRDFILTLNIRGGTVTVIPPKRINFTADKSISGQLNKLELSIYGLSEKDRLALVKDAEDQKRIPISLQVGYKGLIQSVYKGTILTGSNERQGPDIVTKISGLDGGFDAINSFTNRTVRGGKTALDSILLDMPNTGEGKITVRPVLTRPKILVGNSLKLIDEAVNVGETWYIENEQLYIISDNEVVGRFIPVVSAKSGLISTPSRQNKLVTFETEMNPSVVIGGRAQLLSTTAPHLNGIYRVETISYSGDNYGDSWNMVCTGRLVGEVKVL